MLSRGGKTATDAAIEASQKQKGTRAGKIPAPVPACEVTPRQIGYWRCAADGACDPATPESALYTVTSTRRFFARASRPRPSSTGWVSPNPTNCTRYTGKFFSPTR